MDGKRGLAHDAAVLGAAIQQAMEARGLSRGAVGRHFNVETSTVTRWLTGETAVTVRQVIEIEQFLDLEPGELFIRAGLVALPQTTEEVIRTDPALTPTWAAAVLSTYRTGVEESGNRSRSPSRRPAAIKTVRN